MTQLPVVSVTPASPQILFVGDSLQFAASGGTPPYTWSVSDTARGSISAAGWLKAKKSGELSVTAQDDLGGTGSSGVVSIYDFRLTVPDTTFFPSTTVQLPIYVTANSVGFTSLQMVVTYNTNNFMKLVNVVTAGTLTSPFTVALSNTTGSSNIALAGVNAVHAAGVLMYLTFEIPDTTPVSSVTYLTLTSVIFNEGNPKALVKNGSLSTGSRSIIIVTPSSASLTVPVGHRDSVQLTVANAGNINLTSTISVIGSSAFTVSLSNITVIPGNNVKPEIYFKPLTAGPDSAIIQFNTNDPLHSIVNIPVKGSTGLVGVEYEPGNKPTNFVLEQNYPNPFNPSTTLSYSIAQTGMVTLKIFNSLGVEIATLVQKQQTPGRYSILWDATRFSSGVYFCRLYSGSMSEVTKLILLK